MGYTFIHLDDSDARTRYFREWYVPGIGYINVDRRWWFRYHTKTPRQVYDDCNYAKVSIE